MKDSQRISQHGNDLLPVLWLQDSSVQHDLCCDKQDVINDNGTNVCQSCGSVHGHGVADECIDFYEDKGRIIRKSIYHTVF